jgi:endo-1,4-beta-xylanase
MGAAALLAPFAGACAGGVAARTQPPSLRQIYRRHFLVGAAINSDLLARPRDAALLRRHYSSLTPRSALKAYGLSLGEGRYSFADAEAHIRFAHANGMRMRGHTLVWHWKSGDRNAAPDWFFAGDRSDPGYRAPSHRDLVRRRLETYIADVVGRFRGRVYAWDVVNEPASDAAGETYRTDSPWFDALGPDYIEYAFRAARAADPHVQLFINDYNTEQPAKRARLMAIVDDLKAKRVPIDGVGHQLHLQRNGSVEGVADALRATEERGLINHVTELDVSIYVDPGSCFGSGRTGCQADYGAEVPPGLFAEQARLYRALFAEFTRHPSLKSVTTWGLIDADSWLNGFPVPRTNRPLLFDGEGEPKPAFWAVADPNFTIP